MQREDDDPYQDHQDDEPQYKGSYAGIEAIDPTPLSVARVSAWLGRALRLLRGALRLLDTGLLFMAVIAVRVVLDFVLDIEAINCLHLSLTWG